MAANIPDDFIKCTSKKNIFMKICVCCSLKKLPKRTTFDLQAIVNTEIGD